MRDSYCASVGDPQGTVGRLRQMRDIVVQKPVAGGELLPAARLAAEQAARGANPHATLSIRQGRQDEVLFARDRQCLAFEAVGGGCSTCPADPVVIEAGRRAEPNAAI